MKSNPDRKSIKELRSARWFSATDMRGFAHRQRAQQMGLSREEFMGKPIIGIINTWSDLSPCHAHLRERAKVIKRAVIAAGACPFELPAMSLGEVMVKPTTMLYRNFLAMECEELLRSLPLDGAVLMGGCDKTTPGLLLGALSMNIPTVFCPAGPMLNDRYQGKTVGAGTHTKVYWDEYVAGNISEETWIELEAKMTRSPGTCNTMGTASTMTLMVEAMGLTLSGASAIPAMDANHSRMAWQCGKRIVELVWQDIKPRDILTRESFLNALMVWMAIGGSTNAAIHIIALAKRAGVDLSIDDIDRAGQSVPVLCNVFPAGQYLMEDFYYAGGLPALLCQLRECLHLDVPTLSGLTIRDIIEHSTSAASEVIRARDNPITPLPAIAILRGNLCPDGAVIKPSSASPHLLHHQGPALVFDSYPQMLSCIHDPDLIVDENTVLILRHGGPIGAPGMPEWGNLPIPKKLLQRGIRDMLRITDSRMSGTHAGTCVLHVSPEAAIGGALALVKTGDLIEINLDKRSLQVLINDEELAQRRARWTPPPRLYQRGFTRLYQAHVTQAQEGCDFDFLEGCEPTPEPPIH